MGTVFVLVRSPQGAVSSANKENIWPHNFSSRRNYSCASVQAIHALGAFLQSAKEKDSNNDTPWNRNPFRTRFLRCRDASWIGKPDSDAGDLSIRNPTFRVINRESSTRKERGERVSESSINYPLTHSHSVRKQRFFSPHLIWWRSVPKMLQILESAIGLEGTILSWSKC